MFLKVTQVRGIKEPEVAIQYESMTESVRRVISYVKCVDVMILCKQEGQEVYINAADIYYIESVDKRCFVYCETKVYQTDYRLYELEEQLETCRFVRVNKACILNLLVLTGIKPLINSRLEALLSNGERVYVTRKYLSEIKRQLQKKEEGRSNV